MRLRQLTGCMVDVQADPFAGGYPAIHRRAARARLIALKDERRQARQDGDAFMVEVLDFAIANAVAAIRQSENPGRPGWLQAADRRRRMERGA